MTDIERMAVLWEQLPATSRVAKKQSVALQWGTGEYLLWQIEYHLRVLVWSLSYDKKHPQPKPQPIQTPAKLAEAHEKQDRALKFKAEMDKEYGMGG